MITYDAISSAKKNPLLATTYGVGEMILHALENGCRDFIIGIGGSATNDGGIGMLKALGFEFLDENGLDEIDRRVLDAMITKFNGRPVGLDALAAATGEDKDTIEDVYEPYLMQIGFLNRTPRGRVATPMAYEHMNVVMPDKGGNSSQGDDSEMR